MCSPATAQVDEISLPGLTGLGDILVQRTAVEPGEPVGIDIERDEIVFFPLLYWPVTARTCAAPSPETVAKLNTYMKNGGTIFFDTRERGRHDRHAGRDRRRPGWHCAA